MVNVSEALIIGKILEQSGFDDSAQWTIIVAYGFGSYDEILTLGYLEIVYLSRVFSDRTVAAGNICFGLRRTNLMKVTINWAQDFRRISQTPSIIGIIKAAGKTDGQDQEAQPIGIYQPQQGRQSRQAKTTQGLDHMVQGTQ